MFNRTIVWFLGAGLLAGAVFAAEPKDSSGENPNPVHLIRPSVQPFSAMAKLGHELFFDTSLSSSGKLACASCHSPAHAYGPPNDASVMLGGPDLTLQGARAVPSLTYLEQQPEFSIGPDDPLTENVDMAQQATLGKTAARAEKLATQTAQSANIVPQGGLFWDGRANTLQIQAGGPLLDPREMDGGSMDIVAGENSQSALCAEVYGIVRPAHFAGLEAAGPGGDVCHRTLSGRGAELPSLYQQV